VLDASRLDNARLFDDATAAMFDAFVQGNPNHAQDGLLASTALHEDAIFVTGENEQHRRRLKRHFPGLQVWTPDDLRDCVASLSAQRLTEAGSMASGTLSTAPFDGPGRRQRPSNCGLASWRIPSWSFPCSRWNLPRRARPSSPTSFPEMLPDNACSP
jgi:hypothetical protein